VKLSSIKVVFNFGFELTYTLWCIDWYGHDNGIKKEGKGIWRKKLIPESIINNIQIVSWIMATEGHNKIAVSKIHSRFNPATTYLRLYQAKSYVVVTFFLHFFISFCVQWVKVNGNSWFCWYWLTCWFSLFILSFYRS
jgi:hypothetical protein